MPGLWMRDGEHRADGALGLMAPDFSWRGRSPPGGAINPRSHLSGEP